MDRRKFIKNSALAATLVGISPSLSAASDKVDLRKKIIFIFRGVSYTDAFNAFKKFNITSDLNFHIQKTTCINPTYSHTEGITQLLGNHTGPVMETQLQERHTIGQVLEDVFATSETVPPVVHLHHTEIGHSSNKAYIEKLEEFFTELGKHYKADQHKVIITADIGRNETLNSCGGKDHSNSTCLETFALYIGGNASKLAAKNHPLSQKEILKQKF
jgi:hypothetical protein